MRNWFQEHPAFTIVTHTLTVVALSAGAFLFLFDSNKVAAAKAEADQYRAKTETLQSELDGLRADNAKYLEWLSATPNTIPYLEKRVTDLTRENQELRTRAGVKQVAPNLSTAEGRGATISIGETYVDDITGVTLGLSNVNRDFTADVLLIRPGGQRAELKNVKAGEKWGFTYKNVPHQIQLRSVDWFSNKATVAVRESEQ